MKLFDKVKVIQEDAPFNLYGEIGTIVRPELEENDGWLFFRSDNELNDKESYFLPKHLELVKSGTQQHFKDSYELKVFVYEINEHFRNEDIEDRDYSDMVNKEIDTVIEEIEENGISYLKGYEITCDFDE